MVFNLGYVQTNNRQLQNAGKLTTISIAMRIGQYNAGCIAQWSTSKASLKATGHWMLPSGKCQQRRIAPVVAMVIDFK
jgi:hypothetical protein